MTDETPAETEEPTANDVWDDVNPEEEAAAPDEFQEMELDDGKPVVAKYVQEGSMQGYRKQIRARHDDIDEDELGERVIVKVLSEHYKVPDLSYITHKKFKDSKMGYYDRFLDPIAPELARTAGNL